jgi:hypothetical protein
LPDWRYRREPITDASDVGLRIDAAVTNSRPTNLLVILVGIPLAARQPLE